MEVPEELIEAKDEVQFELLELPGVTGVGIGFREEAGNLFEEDLAVRIYVADENEVPEGLPEEVGGVPVCLIQMDVVPCAEDVTRYEELKGGIRIAHPAHGFGTLGTIVKREEEGEPSFFGLTCEHVVGDGEGDEFPYVVWQDHEPPLTGEIPTDDAVGLVVDAAYPKPDPLVVGAIVHDVDAAIFSLDLAAQQERGFSSAIADDSGEGDLISQVTSSELPHLGQIVQKRGFVTRVTRGLVVDLHCTCRWNPKAGPNRHLVEQVQVTGIGAGAGTSPVFAAEGDSGSLVLDEQSGAAVGLLYGMDPTPGFFGPGVRCVFNKMAKVESALGINPVW